MKWYPVKVEVVAQAAMSALSIEDRRRVEEVIERLHEGPNPGGWPQAKRLEGDDELYMLRVTDPLRILYTVQEDEQIVVRDVINYNFAKHLFRSAAG